MAAKMNFPRPTSWLVYARMTINNKKEIESFIVCEQREWDRMDENERSRLRLVQDGFENETDAEKCARGTSGDDYRSRKAKPA